MDEKGTNQERMSRGLKMLALLVAIISIAMIGVGVIATIGPSNPKALPIIGISFMLAVIVVGRLLVSKLR